MRQVNPDPYLHEVNTMADAIKATLPGYSSEVPIRYDALGNPVKVPGRFLSTRQNSEINKAFDELFVRTGRYPISAPGPYVGDGVGKFDMRTMDLESGQNAYERFKELSGRPKGRPSLEESLTRLVGSPQYKALVGTELAAGVDGAQAMVTSMVEDYRRAAMAQMMQESKVFREARGKRAEDLFAAASAGAKSLESVRAESSAQSLNNLLAPYGMGIPTPSKTPQ
jgi:hypothetical protein